MCSVARVCVLVCAQVSGGAGGAGGGEEAWPAAGAGAGGGNITMPGTNKPRAPLYDYDDDRPASADVSYTLH